MKAVPSLLEIPGLTRPDLSPESARLRKVTFYDSGNFHPIATASQPLQRLLCQIMAAQCDIRTAQDNYSACCNRWKRKHPREQQPATKKLHEEDLQRCTTSFDQACERYEKLRLHFIHEVEQAYPQLREEFIYVAYRTEHVITRNVGAILYSSILIGTEKQAILNQITTDDVHTPSAKYA